MPRYTRIPAILRTATKGNPKEVADEAAPRLWNAKRRIKSSQGLSKSQWLYYKKNPETDNWRQWVSQDVADFVDVNTSDKDEHIQLREHKLLPEEKAFVLRNPSRYFSRPHNVPVLQRKQTHLYARLSCRT